MVGSVRFALTLLSAPNGLPLLLGDEPIKTTFKMVGPSGFAPVADYLSILRGRCFTDTRQETSPNKLKWLVHVESNHNIEIQRLVC